MGAVSVLLSREGPPARETALRMLAAAPHRGDRREVITLGQVALGACNDPDWITATLHRDEEAGLAAAFSGALDNASELRARLAPNGVPRPGPGTDSPAALLLAAFRTWGEDAVSRLRGSFAGAVTDGRELVCFRDQFGSRPLFHHDAPGAFHAASEVKQVLAGAGLAREPDMDHLHGVLFGGIERSTAFRGVERIPKCTLARTGRDPGLDVEEYWDPARFVEAADMGPEEAVEGTREALDRAVRRVLTGRDAILLSGGLDSPALAAFAARVEGRHRPVRALTSVYPEHPSADESGWTELAARRLGIPLHRYVAEAGSLDDVDEWVEVLDGPVDVLSIPESAESYSEARRLGARTVLSGEIAEMVFECRGYLLDHLLSHGRLSAAVRVLAGMRGAGRSRRSLVRRVMLALAPPPLAAAYAERREADRSGPPGWVDADRARTSRRASTVLGMSPRRRWVRMQTAPFIGPGIGFEADEICAAVCGVDVRRPFADVDLWEFVLSVPAEVKFPNRRTKPLLRQAMRGLLPDELIDRRDKTYFDEFHLATADYETMERLLVEPRHRLEGIDYGLLRERIEARDMRVYELQWARNVARVHAFLNRW